MLRIVQHFGKHCRCHIQEECVLLDHFWWPYIGKGVGGAWNVMELICGVEKLAAIQ
jgi:hypothetical protein